MCTFKSDRVVEVCDPAIARVYEALEAAFPGAVHFTHVDFQPTLVEAGASVEIARFGALIRAAVAAAAAETLPPRGCAGFGRSGDSRSG